MKILEKKDNQITFEAEIEESLANAIRRYLNHVPTIAIKDVEIIKNGSPLYDETVAHRMGLIPIKNKSLKKDEKIILNLKSDKEGMVYSNLLKGDAEVIYGEIPITSLDKNQEIEIIAEVGEGIGKEHSKYSPGFMYYRNVCELTLDKKYLSEIKKIFPNLEVKEKGEKIIIKDDNKKSIGDTCEGLCEKNREKAEIKIEKNLIISLESFGQMEVKETFKKSVEELKKDLNEFSKKISK
jgi:DNA-directed RNA polymerase subunit D